MINKTRLITYGQQMAAFEQKVSIADRDWPELIELEQNGYETWVPIFDAEMSPIALVCPNSVEVICEVLNRFEHDTPIDCDERKAMKNTTDAVGSSRLVMPVECGRYLWDTEPVTVYWQDNVLLGETSTVLHSVKYLDLLLRTENSIQHRITADAPWQRVGDCCEGGCESARHIYV